jgi:hypothetical protein
MRLSRIVFVLASLVLAGAQAFGAKTVGFAATVTYSSGQGANSVIAADVNSDGFPDLIVATNNGVSVLLNFADGTFAPPTTYVSGGTFSNAIALADVNFDGNLDIIVTNECLAPTFCNGVAVLLGNGDGTFQSAMGYDSGGLETGGLAVGDVNMDGFPDLILVSNCQLQTCAGGTSTLLLNNGDGTFGSPMQISDGTGPIAIGDMNGDGIPDLVTAAGIMLGVGDGTFNWGPNSAVVNGAISFSLADLNGDGKLDVVAAVPKGVAVQLGNGDGTLQSPAILAAGGGNPLSVTVSDFNGDGFLDLAVANECTTFSGSKCTGNGRVGVLAGNGDGTFQVAVLYTSGGAFATSVTAVDEDQDGKMDLVVADACAQLANCANGLVGTLLNNFTAAVTVQLVSSANPAVLGQSVTFTATLTSSPRVPDGGQVTFTDGTATLGTSTTVGGVASLTTTFSRKGGHSIKATFNGDLYHRTGAKALSETVNAYPSTTTVTSSPNPSTFGQAVMITATVSSAGPTPTGTVTFRNGTLVLGSAALSGGTASITKTNLPVGTNSINVTYHGDTQTATSTGATDQTVN